MEIKIIFRVNEPENIKFKIVPEPDRYNDINECVYAVKPNQPMDINFIVTDRIGIDSNIIIEKILYQDFELTNLDHFCTLFKDDKANKTHGYIDGGNYRIRIRGNPISQQFIEYFLDLAFEKDK